MGESFLVRKGGGGGGLSVNFINESTFYHGFESTPVVLNRPSNTSTIEVERQFYTSIGFPSPTIYTAVRTGVGNGRYVASFNATTGEMIANSPISPSGPIQFDYNASLGSIVCTMVNFTSGQGFLQRFNPFTLALEATSPFYAAQKRMVAILQSNVYAANDNNLVKHSSTLQVLNSKALSMGGNMISANDNLYVLQGNGQVFRYISTSNLNTPSQALSIGAGTAYPPNLSFSNNNLYIQLSASRGNDLSVVNVISGQATIKNIGSFLTSTPLENNNFVYVFTNRENGSTHVLHAGNLNFAFNYAITGITNGANKNFVFNNLYFNYDGDPPANGSVNSSTVRSMSFNGAIVSINNQQYYLFKK
jgi:hypothetical protein